MNREDTQKILKEVKNTCNICKNKEKKKHIHHLDCNHENNKRDNLIVLCPVCHKVLHTYLKEVRENTIKELREKCIQHKIVRQKRYKIDTITKRLMKNIWNSKKLNMEKMAELFNLDMMDTYIILRGDNKKYN